MSALPWSRPDRVARLTEALSRRILVIDGAMGTMIQRHELDEAGYRGERFAQGYDDQHFAEGHHHGPDCGCPRQSGPTPARRCRTAHRHRACLASRRWSFRRPVHRLRPRARHRSTPGWLDGCRRRSVQRHTASCRRSTRQPRANRHSGRRWCQARTSAPAHRLRTPEPVWNLRIRLQSPPRPANIAQWTVACRQLPTPSRSGPIRRQSASASADIRHDWRLPVD